MARPDTAQLVFGKEYGAADSQPVESLPPQNLNRRAGSVISASHRRRFGQVFTPPRVAALMADWVATIQPQTILDPAVGLGALVEACLARSPNSRIDAFDLDPKILSHIPEHIATRSHITCRDFLTSNIDFGYDAIILNPPYIRHRELLDHSLQRERVSRESQCSIPQSANLYVDFVLKTLVLLNVGGRAAILIPAEWTSANFAKSLKAKLIDSGYLRAIVTFSHGSRVFDDALTTASVLLIEKSEAFDHISSYFLDGVDADKVATSIGDLETRYPPLKVARALLRDAEKWEPLLRGSVVQVPDGWTTLGSLSKTRRGIATGANQFFLLDKATIERVGLRSQNLSPCVGRSRDVNGLIFQSADFESLDKSGGKGWLLDFAVPPNDRELVYITSGEDAGLTSRFLLRTRRPWFSMEKREPSRIWAAVFGRGELRFVYNAANVKSLTNFHCLYPFADDEISAQALTAVLNSGVVREMMANHRRGFGGGLSKFEPNDLVSIPVPDLRNAPPALLEQLADGLRTADTSIKAGHPNPMAQIDRIVEQL